MNNKWIEKRK